jgi:hypothetical protein
MRASKRKNDRNMTRHEAKVLGMMIDSRHEIG